MKLKKYNKIETLTEYFFSYLNISRQAGFYPSKMIFIFILTTLTVLSESAGITMFIPIFQFIRLGGDISALTSEHTFWNNIEQFFSFVGLEVSLLGLLLLAWAFFLIRQIIIFYRIITEAKIRENITMNVRKNAFTHYINTGSYYHDKYSSDEVTGLFTIEIPRAIVCILGPITMISYFIHLFTFGSILAFISWQSISVGLLIAPFIIFLLRYWSKKIFIVGEFFTKANNEMTSFLSSRLRSIKLIQISSMQDQESKSYASKTEAQARESIKGRTLIGKTEVAFEPIMLALCCIFIYVSTVIGNMSIEVMGIFLVLLIRLVPVIKSCIVQGQNITQSLPSLNYTYKSIDEFVEAKENIHTGKHIKAFKNSIVIKRVSYKYPENNTKALDDISLTINRGTIIALVGPSGSGKSTLFDLLVKAKLPNSGNIYIDDLNFSEVKTSSIRNLFSYAPQKTHLLGDSIINHIIYGNQKELDQSNINVATKLAAADTFINNISGKINYKIGSDGLKLSGGERQRIDLARIMYSDKDIFLLDEPTSNLDQFSEEVIVSSLNKLRDKKKTIIISAHRLSTAVRSDIIYVFSDGKITHKGDHKFLMNNCIWYKNAWNGSDYNND